VRVTGSVLSLPFDNIDTDQIVPAAHLTTLETTGLGQFLFTGHPDLAARLARREGACVLVAGRDFGCGSSREHAVWALLERGFRAVLAPNFARIFLENAYTNGLVPVALSEENVAICAVSETLTVDVVEQTVTVQSGECFSFPLDPLRKTFLLGGGYLEFLHSKIPAITAWRAQRAARSLVE
jgi:3-isopropylmalate/(R)-2-methylmalate dehydratase small subunit